MNHILPQHQNIELYPLTPEMRRDTLTSMEIERTGLDTTLIAIRNGHIARLILKERGELPDDSGDDGVAHFPAHDLYSSGNFIYDAKSTTTVFDALPTSALEIVEETGRSALHTLFEQKAPILRKAANNSPTTKVLSAEDHLQEGFFVLIRIALRAPNSEKFDGYLWSSLKNMQSRQTTETNRHRARPLTRDDERKGHSSDRFMHPENFGEFALTGIISPTRVADNRGSERFSSTILHDEPSAELTYIDEAERNRSRELLTIPHLERFLGQLRFFQVLPQRSPEQAQLNVAIMLGTLLPELVDPEYKDKNLLPKTSGGQPIVYKGFDLKLGYLVMPKDRIAKMKSEIDQELKDAGVSPEQFAEAAQLKLDDRILMQVWQYRKRGRDCIAEYLYNKGYSFSEDSIESSSLLDAIADANR